MKEILLYSYWEHVKAEKELARIYPPGHKLRISIIAVINDLSLKINEIKNT